MFDRSIDFWYEAYFVEKRVIEALHEQSTSLILLFEELLLECIEYNYPLYVTIEMNDILVS